MPSPDVLDEYSEPDPDAVLADAPHESTLAELLGLCDEFFRCHASPAVGAERREFLTDRGHHPIAGHGAFTDSLGFAALAPARGHQDDRPGTAPVTMKSSRRVTDTA